VISCHVKCTGNLQLYYFYICMQKHGLLQSACSAMSKRDSHSSGESNPRASGVDRRPSKGGGDIDLNAPIEVLKSADESALIKAKRGIAENKAAVSRDDAMEVLSKKHENALADLEAYESGINSKMRPFSTSSRNAGSRCSRATSNASWGPFKRPARGKSAAFQD